MAVTLIGAGGLFTRIGHILGIALNINVVRGSTIVAPNYSVTTDSKIVTLQADYANGTARRDIVDQINAQLTSYHNAHGSFLTYLSGIASTTVVEMVNDDTKLSSKTLKIAMTELIRQMKSNSDDVNASAPAAGAQTDVGTPTGTTIVVASVKGDTGLLSEYAFAETIKFQCTTDAQSGGATARQETVTITTPVAQANELHEFWPLGSGVSKTLTAVDATLNNSGGNLLQNSDFETFTTANHADNWTRVVGIIGTTKLNGGSSNAYTGSGSLAFVGDGGGTLSEMTQKFDITPTTTVDAGGTAAELEPATSYALNLWVKVSATPAAGVLTFSLIDGAGATINDDAATANSFTKSLTAVTTTFVNVNGVFRTPSLLPSTGIKLRVRLSTAIDNAKTVYLDRMALNEMTQLYDGGPFVSVFSGATNAIVGDTWTVAITNTFGGFQQGFERLFGMRTLGLQLPSDSGGGENVLDSLIA